MVPRITDQTIVQKPERKIGGLIKLKDKLAIVFHHHHDDDDHHQQTKAGRATSLWNMLVRHFIALEKMRLTENERLRNLGYLWSAMYLIRTSPGISMHLWKGC